MAWLKAFDLRGHTVKNTIGFKTIANVNRNKHGPIIAFTATRGDPDIGRFKRGRAPCPSTLKSFLEKRKMRVAGGLDASCLPWRNSSGRELYAFNMKNDLSAHADPEGVKIIFSTIRTATLPGLYWNMEKDLSAYVDPEGVKIIFNTIRTATLPSLNLISNLSACVSPGNVKVNILN